MKTKLTPMSQWRDRHDYEPSSMRSRTMQTDPDCRICGHAKRDAIHREAGK